MCIICIHAQETKVEMDGKEKRSFGDQKWLAGKTNFGRKNKKKISGLGFVCILLQTRYLNF